MRYLAIYTTFCLVFCLFLAESKANNVQLSQVRLTAKDTSAGPNSPDNFTFVRFNLRWENAWRLGFSVGINNHDAVWLFVKWRRPFGEWQHAYLNNNGHDPGNWNGLGAGPALIEPGLADPAAAFDRDNNPAMGVIISNGSTNIEPGLFEATQMRVRWNYGAQGIADNELVEIRVFALEMVFVPSGAFFVGTEGTENGSLTNGSWSSGPTIPLRIAAEDALNINTGAGNLWGRSSSSDSSIGDAGSLPALYPKGYSGFLAMKYEITQQQWVDFFNMLTPTQQANRDITAANGKNSDALVNRNNISWTAGSLAVLPGNTHGDLPCNFLNWADVAAYLDWAALRPMSELEFEKAARGERMGVANEYAWGSDDLTASTYSLANHATANELIAANYSSAVTGGNAWYTATQVGDGPVRVGIFAADTASTGRNTAGAARYGLLEMSGNLWETVVNLSTANGRNYTAVHGNGQLNANGNADVANWPDSTAIGAGYRGGAWNSPASELHLANRARANLAVTDRTSSNGGRGVRSLPCSLPTGLPNTITDSILINYENVRELTTGGASGGDAYLWVVPSDWRIISGQGTNKIYVTVQEFPATVWVMFVNQCGSAEARTRVFTE